MPSTAPEKPTTENSQQAPVNPVREPEAEDTNDIFDFKQVIQICTSTDGRILFDANDIVGYISHRMALLLDGDPVGDGIDVEVLEELGHIRSKLSEVVINALSI